MSSNSDSDNGTGSGDDSTGDTETDREFGNSLNVDFGDAEEGEGLEPIAETSDTDEDTHTTDTQDTHANTDNTDTSMNTSVETGDNSDGVRGSGSRDSDSGRQKSRTEKQDIPHRVRCDSPKENREAISMFVSSEEKQRLSELQHVARSEFDETVYQIDVYLAALRGSMHDETRFIEEMRRIGYGYFD